MNNKERSFLKLLSKHGMKNPIIFDAGKSFYTQDENNVIKSISESIEEILKKMSQARGIAPYISAFCLHDEAVNAFCFIDDAHYYIAIHSGTYVELFRRSQRLSDYIADNGIAGYTEKDRIRLLVSIWNYAFKMILAHEYMHIILGHCDLSNKPSLLLWEAKNDLYECEAMHDRLYRHALEMFADEFAAMDMTRQVLANTGESIDELKKELLVFYLAIVLKFSIFDDNVPFNERHHPRPRVRLYYIAAAIDETIGKSMEMMTEDVNCLLFAVNSIWDDVLAIIHRFQDLFSGDLLRSWLDINVNEEYLEIYNAASVVVKDANKFALWPIDEYASLDMDALLQAIIEEKGLLSEAAASGLSFEEANDLLDRRNL